MIEKILTCVAILYLASTTVTAHAITESDFSQRSLSTNLEQPMAMEVDPDGNIFVIGRCGRFYVWSPNTQAVRQTSTVNVRCDLELGLIGITLDPNYASNRWVYLHYNPRGQSKQRVSRFKMNPNNSLDKGSEIVMLEFPVQTDQCCHQGGDLEFGPAGNLFISVGDNVNPFAANGFAPIDERAGRAAWDAQGTSSNTNDLRGKILRIRPNNNGTYSIPNGNLFAGNSLHRPEIYVMGNRNPFRMTIDEQTGYLYWGEIGPDANRPNSSRGPAGYDEINQARQAGNYGWPYVTGFNEPYRDFNFNTRNSGSLFNVNRPRNDSPNNNGAAFLPATKEAWLRYPHQAMMAGVLYHYDSSLNNDQRLPRYFDNRLIFWNFNNGDIYTVEKDANDNNPEASVFFNRLTDRQSLIDMTLDNEDRMLVLGYDRNYNGHLSRIEFNGDQHTGNSEPIVFADIAPTDGLLPLTVSFSASGSTDPDGDALSYTWDFTGDGTIDSTLPVASYVYTAEGQYNAQLRVTDSQGNVVIRNFTVLAGIAVPKVVVTSPGNGSFFEYGDVINWQVSVADASFPDGIDCSDVTVELALGHVTGATVHEHGLDASNGCSGSFETAPEGGHDGADIFLMLIASYTNSEGIPASSTLELRPRLREAEHWTQASGVKTESTTDIDGGDNVAFINSGDWLMFRDMNLVNVDEIDIRVASNTSGGTIEARIGGVSGHVIGSVNVPYTGGWQAWDNLTIAIDPTDRDFGATDLYFTFSGSSNYLFNINWFDFIGDFVDDSEAIATPVNPTSEPAETTLDTMSLITQRIEAESFTAESGIRIVSNSADDGENIGYIQNGDSSDYVLEVPSTGTFDIAFNVASQSNGGTITLTKSGVAVASVSVPVTGGWQNWVTVKTTALLSAGTGTYRLEYSGGSGYLFNVNWFEFTGAADIIIAPTPDNSNPDPIIVEPEPVATEPEPPLVSTDPPDTTPNPDGLVSQRIEAESFSTQSGIRTLTKPVGGGELIGYIQSGDTSDYVLDVTTSGTYDLAFRVASLKNGGTIALTQNGLVLASVTAPVTGEWQNWVTVETAVNLTAGSGTYRLEYNGGDGYLFNIDWFELSGGDVAPVTPNPEPINPTPDTSGSGVAHRIEAEEFTAQSGIRSEATSDADGGENIGYIQSGDSSDYVLDLASSGAHTLAFRVASLRNGGMITVTQGGDVVASVAVPTTGGWQNWVTVATTAVMSAGTYRLEYSGGNGYLFNVNWFEVKGVGL